MPPSRIARVSKERSKPHEVCAVATSLELFNKVDLQAVMKAGRWLMEAYSHPTVFETSAHKLVVAAGEIVEIS